MRIIEAISENKSVSLPCLELYDAIEHKGCHSCLIFDATSKSLMDHLVDRTAKPFPIRTVKLVSRQILFGLQFLQEKCNIIHPGVKLDSITLAFTSQKKEKLCCSAKNAPGQVMAAKARGLDAIGCASKVSPL